MAKKLGLYNIVVKGGEIETMTGKGGLEFPAGFQPRQGCVVVLVKDDTIPHGPLFFGVRVEGDEDLPRPERTFVKKYKEMGLTIISFGMWDCKEFIAFFSSGMTGRFFIKEGVVHKVEDLGAEEMTRLRIKESLLATERGEDGDNLKKMEGAAHGLLNLVQVYGSEVDTIVLGALCETGLDRFHSVNRRLIELGMMEKIEPEHRDESGASLRIVKQPGKSAADIAAHKARLAAQSRASCAKFRNNPHLANNKKDDSKGKGKKKRKEAA